MKLATARAWYILQASLGVLVTATWLREFARTFAPDTIEGLDVVDHGRLGGRAVAVVRERPADDDAELTELARATGVMPNRCPHLADDQDPELNARGGSRFCGLPLDHPGADHPSLIESAAADR